MNLYNLCSHCREDIYDNDIRFKGKISLTVIFLQCITFVYRYWTVFLLYLGSTVKHSYNENAYNKLKLTAKPVSAP